MEGLWVALAGYRIQLPNPPFFSESCSNEKEFLQLMKEKNFELIIIEEKFCRSLFHTLDFIKNLQPQIHIILIADNPEQYSSGDLYLREIDLVLSKNEWPEKIISAALELVQGSLIPKQISQQLLLFPEEKISLFESPTLNEIDHKNIMDKLNNKIKEYVDMNLPPVWQKEVTDFWEKQGDEIIRKELHSSFI